MKRFPSIALSIACAALAACGGGAHSSGTVPASSGSGANQLFTGPHNTAPAPGAVTAHLTVTVPAARQTAATRRRPQYIASYTAGIEVEAVQNNVTSGFEFFPLGVNEPGCTAYNAGFTCSLTVAAPIGQTQILVATTDSTNEGSGNLLSMASANVTIQAGINNVVPITTLPIAANVSPVTQPPRCVVYGTPTTVNTTYTAYDADGGDLTGLSLANSISLTNVNPVDSASGYTISPSTFTSGSGSLTFTYNGSDSNIGIFNITASLAPNGNVNQYVGILGVIPVATAGPHMVYVSDSAENEILGYDACSNSQQQTPIVYNLPAGTNPVAVKFDRSSTALDPRLFVLGGGATGPLIWLDVASAPGTAIGASPYTFGSQPHHMQDSSTSPALFVTVGSNTLKKFTINEAGPSLSGVSYTGFTQPRGFNLEGSGNDMLVTNNSLGTVSAVNPSTGVVDATVSPFANPAGVSGPNGPTPNCALVTGQTPNELAAVSLGATPATGTQLIGSPIALAGTPVSVVFFPPQTPGSGTIGVGGITALVALSNAPAELVSCEGTLLVDQGPWTTFMDQPAGLTPSTYSSLAVPGIIYATGLDQGVPVLQAFTSTYDHDLGAVELPGGATPTDVTAGP